MDSFVIHQYVNKWTGILKSSPILFLGFLLFVYLVVCVSLRDF